MNVGWRWTVDGHGGRDGKNGSGGGVDDSRSGDKSLTNSFRTV